MTRPQQPAPTTTPSTDIGLTTGRTRHPSPAAKKGLLAGVVLFLACAAACSLPVLLAGGAAISAGALFSGADTVAVALLGTTALTGALVWRLRRRRAQNTGHACGSNCGC